MKSSHRSLVRPSLLILAIGLLVGPLWGQVCITELETTGGVNDTFATAESCRQIGNSFVIKGTVHSGNPDSDDEWYSFDGNAGACLNLDMEITQPVSTSTAMFQLNMWLFDSSQTMIAAWNMTSAQSGTNFGIGNYTLPSTGTYYIYITEWSVGPNALAQSGLTFTPLSSQGFAVTGATPDSTRNTAGGNQTFGSLYELSVNVSGGNEAAFNVWVDCDAATGAITCSPDPARVCWSPGGTNVTFAASAACPAGGVTVAIQGGGSGALLPGGSVVLGAPGPGVSSPVTVDDGTGAQVCGVVETLRTLVLNNGEVVSQVDVCAGFTTCLSVCGPAASTYVAALSETCGPPIGIGPFLPDLELDLGSLLFAATFPINQLAPLVSGLVGVPGSDQICFAVPTNAPPTPFTIYLQVVTISATGVSGLSNKVALNVRP